MPAGRKERLQDDRSLAIYILLSIVTCGIYSYYFIYKMAHDVNIACEGDMHFCIYYIVIPDLWNLFILLVL